MLHLRMPAKCNKIASNAIGISKADYWLLQVASFDANSHSGHPQLSGDVIEMSGGHHDADVTAHVTGTRPEIRLQAR